MTLFEEILEEMDIHDCPPAYIKRVQFMIDGVGYWTEGECNIVAFLDKPPKGAYNISYLVDAKKAFTATMDAHDEIMMAVEMSFIIDDLSDDLPEV